MTSFIDPASVQRTVLTNGLTVLIRSDRSAPVVAIVTHVKAGYFDETDDVSGIAHVLEHMFFKGTARRGVGEIAKETKASGGYLNAHTIYDNTTYSPCCRHRDSRLVSTSRRTRMPIHWSMRRS